MYTHVLALKTIVFFFYKNFFFGIKFGHFFLLSFRTYTYNLQTWTSIIYNRTSEFLVYQDFFVI